MTKAKDDDIPVLTDADFGKPAGAVDVPVLGEDAFSPGQPIRSKSDKPADQPKLSDEQKLGSSAATGAIRAAGVPVDLLSLLPNVPSLAFRGMKWLGETTGLSSPEKLAAAEDLIRKLSPDKFNEWFRPHTSEGQLGALRQVGAIPPDYIPDTAMGGLGKAALERGPAMFTGGALFGMPARLNAMTSVTAPIAGQLAANVAGEKYGEPARMGAEILASLVTPPSLATMSAIKREMDLSTRRPISELVSDPKKIKSALPWMREMVKDKLTQPTRDTILRGVENPDQANAALQGMRPNLTREMSDDLSAQTAAAQQRHTTTEQQALAAQSAREQAARQAEADALTLEQQLRQPGRIRESEDIGAALHGVAVGAKEALKQNVLDPLYSAPWKSVKVDTKEVQGVVDEIDNLTRLLARKKATGSANPSGFLDTQLNKLVTYDDVGNRIVKPVRAEVLDQIRREMDASLEALGKSEKTIAKALNVELQPVRKAINDAFDATPDLNMMLKRMGDEAFAETGAPLSKGVTKKVLSDKATPSTAAKTLIPSGLVGREAVDELDKLIAAQAKAGVPSSDIHALVQEQIQRNIIDATKPGDLARGLAHTLSNKGYGPFLRNYDARYGTTLTDDLKQQLAIQQAKQGARETALLGEREGVSTTNRLLSQSAAERDAIIKEAERNIANAVQSRIAGAEYPGNDLATLFRDPNAVKEINSLINSAAKHGQTKEMYEAITGALQRDLVGAMSEGKGFGAVPDMRELGLRYTDALRRVGAPQKMIDNINSAMTDTARLRSMGGVGEKTGQEAIRAEKQILYGALGRQGGLLQAAMNKLFGNRDVALEVWNMALRDPKIAKELFAYEGKNPDHFMRYMLRNPTLSAALASVREKQELAGEQR
jgi:hypothetical protein